MLNFWYPWADWDRHSTSQPEALKIWFGGGPEIDAALTQMFKADLEAISAGQNEHWKNDHLGKLAYIIVCDQYSRNIYRKQGKAFSTDHRSLVMAKAICSSDEDIRSYKNDERIFIFMPLMHSENAEDIQMCCDMF